MKPDRRCTAWCQAPRGKAPAWPRLRERPRDDAFQPLAKESISNPHSIKLKMRRRLWITIFASTLQSLACRGCNFPFNRELLHWTEACLTLCILAVSIIHLPHWESPLLGRCSTNPNPPHCPDPLVPNPPRGREILRWGD